MSLSTNCFVSTIGHLTNNKTSKQQKRDKKSEKNKTKTDTKTNTNTDTKTNTNTNTDTKTTVYKSISHHPNSLRCTRVCNSVANNVPCKYKSNCRFAHHLGELSPIICQNGDNCRHVCWNNQNKQWCNKPNNYMTCLFIHPDEKINAYASRCGIIIPPPPHQNQPPPLPLHQNQPPPPPLHQNQPPPPPLVNNMNNVSYNTLTSTLTLKYSESVDCKQINKDIMDALLQGTNDFIIIMDFKYNLESIALEIPVDILSDVIEQVVSDKYKEISISIV